ncbi:MAG: hypothetical protein V1722_03925 [Candidatus Micrarchaeota archaeon]
MSFKETLKFYKFANKQRDEFYSIKWRLFVTAIIVVIMWFVYNHLQTTYPSAPEMAIISAASGTAVQASDRLFNWFVTGFFVGFLAFALMFEGEFLIASMKISKLLKNEPIAPIRKTKKAKRI